MRSSNPPDSQSQRSLSQGRMTRSQSSQAEDCGCKKGFVMISKEEIAALRLELEAAQTNLQLEKRCSQTAQEKKLLLESQIRAFITNMEESLAVTHQTFNPQDVDINPRSMNSPVLLEVETLRGSVTSPKQDMEFLESERDIDEEIPIIEHLQSVMDIEEEIPITEHQCILEDLNIPTVPVTVLEDIEDSLTDAGHTSTQEVNLGVAKHKRRREFGVPENLIIRDAIKRFSAAHPKKWVDECRHELGINHQILIGSSSLTTIKFRKK